MKKKDLAKTASSRVVAVEYGGGLLSRVVAEGGVLIGNTVMVPAGCRCAVLAGDTVTAVLGAGPSLLSLEHFNRQPSALLYALPEGPVTLSWYPSTTALRRTVTLEVADPAAFVERTVMGSGLEQTEAVVRYLGERIDAAIPPGSLAAATEEAGAAIQVIVAAHGLTLLHFEEAAAPAPPPVPS